MGNVKAFGQDVITEQSEHVIAPMGASVCYACGAEPSADSLSDDGAIGGRHSWRHDADPDPRRGDRDGGELRRDLAW
jgi:hypothetical protein